MSCVKLLHKALDRSNIDVQLHKIVWAFFAGLTFLIGGITAFFVEISKDTPAQPVAYEEAPAVVQFQEAEAHDRSGRRVPDPDKQQKKLANPAPKAPDTTMEIPPPQLPDLTQAL